jgi:Spy/CpxP family protein refolding chaperone
MVNARLKKILILFSVAMNLGIFAFALYHYAAQGPHRKEWHKDRHQRFYERLELSPRQAAQIDALVEEYMERKRELGKEDRNLERELLVLLREEVPDSGKLDNILDQMASLRRRREELTFRHLAKVRDLLTDKQAEKMFSILSKHAGKKRGGEHGRTDQVGPEAKSNGM